MDVATLEWLQGPEGEELLAEVAELRQDRDDLAVATALHGRHDADRLAAATTQVELRERGVEKFGDWAPRMFFTRDGLEQATRRRIAEHRVARMLAAEVGTLIDLGCGIGGDLVAAAAGGITAAGVDLDPLRVAVASANLAALGLGGATLAADATTMDTGAFDVAFADPARRDARGRTHRPEDWSPDWTFVADLLRRDACIKVAPGIAHTLIPAGVEAEWISDRGALKEAALWSGRLATDARRATVIAGDGLATVTDQDPTCTDVGPMAAFLYEPDDAVIRAGLVGAVAAGVRGTLVDSRIAYVTSAHPYRTPFAQGYRVVEELPFRERGLRAALRERGIGRLTIKKRGVAVVPEQLRRRLALRGDDEATVVLTRTPAGGGCWLVEPLTSR